jgi:hypothetical protein
MPAAWGVARAAQADGAAVAALLLLLAVAAANPVTGRDAGVHM